DADPQRPRGDGQAVDVAQLALIRAEAQGSVTLDVLDRLEALAYRQLDAGGGDVVLQVDELLGRPRGGLVVRYQEQRHGRFLAARLGLRQTAVDRLEAGLLGRLGTGPVAIGEHLAEAEHAVHR